MKIDLHPANPKRWLAAARRNATTDCNFYLFCEIRKCRRDGACSGPLMLIDTNDNKFRVAPRDLATIAKSEEAVPVCYFGLTERSRDQVADRVDAFVAAAGAGEGSIVDPSRQLGARRWRKLRLVRGR